MIFLQKYESGDSVLNAQLFRDRFNAVVDAVMALQNLTGDSLINVQDFGAGYVINWRGPKSFPTGGGVGGEEERFWSQFTLGVTADGAKLKLYNPFVAPPGISYGRIVYSLVYYDDSRFVPFARTSGIAVQYMEWTPKHDKGWVIATSKIFRTDSSIRTLTIIVDTAGNVGMPVINVLPAILYIGAYENIGGRLMVTQYCNQYIPQFILADSENPISQIAAILENPDIIWSDL